MAMNKKHSQEMAKFLSATLDFLLSDALASYDEGATKESRAVAFSRLAQFGTTLAEFMTVHELPKLIRNSEVLAACRLGNEKLANVFGRYVSNLGRQDNSERESEPETERTPARMN